jgi:hypothetical protein
MAGLMRLSVWCLVAFVLAASPIAAHEGHTHRYMGTIASATDTRLTLKTTDGKTVAFKLDETTRIVKGKETAGVKDLATGARAVVEADGGKEPALAKTIKLAPAPTTPGTRTSASPGRDRPGSSLAGCAD